MYEMTNGSAHFKCVTSYTRHHTANHSLLSFLFVVQLNQKSTAMAEEITALEVELRESAVRSGELAVSAAAQPNGACVQLGALCLVLVEGSWGWIGRDDQLHFPMVTEVEIHEQVKNCAACDDFF